MKGTVTHVSSARAGVSASKVPDVGFGRAAALIFATALVVRLVHLWQIRSAPFFSVLMGDSHGYDQWAQRIAHGEWIGREVFYQAPLYPYFLGTIYAIGGRSFVLVRMIQALIGSASCALLGLAAARLFSKPAGIAAGVMLAVYAPAIFFDGLLQKSVLDVFFVCLALALISQTINTEHAKHEDSPSWIWLWLGLAMGCLSLTRENALVFVVVIVAWALTTHERLRHAAIFLVGLAIVLLPVAARNRLVGGGFFITTSQSGPNFYIGNNPHADGTYASLRFGRGAPEYERQDATELAEHALGRRLTPGEVSSYWTDQALAFITSRPGTWLTLMGRKVALLVNAAEMVDTESQETHAEWSWPLRIAGPVGHFGLLIPLALFGVVVSWPSRSRLWVLYAMTLTYGASVVLFYVFARYRYPLVPFLILFAAPGVLALPDAVRRREVPGGVWTLVAIVGAAIVSNWPMLSTDFMRAVTETNLGTAFQADRRFDEAEAHYRRAIAIRTDYAPAFNNMGTALKAEGRLDEAVATYEQALRVQPDFPDAHYNLANALFEAGRTDEAIGHFESALRLMPGSVEAHNNLGIALAAKGRDEDAAAQFRAALELDPESAKSHRNLGDVLASAGQAAEAIDHLRRAVQLDPSDASAHYDLGSALLDAHQLDEAIVEFRAALKLTPASVEAHNNLGIALGSQGKLEAAIEEFQQALKLDPGFADARQNLQMALAARRQK
jgi:tetratricopeptide (TPR) repeat protein